MNAVHRYKVKGPTVGRGLILYPFLTGTQSNQKTTPDTDGSEHSQILHRKRNSKIL